MRFFKTVSFLYISLVTIACSKEYATESIVTPETQEQEVRIAAPQTRALLDDNLKFSWQTGDRIAILANNSDGTRVLDATTFKYWANTVTPNRSFFTGKLTTALATGTYTYYALSPATATVDGNNATFTIPSEQNGEYNSNLDIMTGSATAQALVACDGTDNGDYLNDINLQLTHRSHALRFTIPEGRNYLGKAVKKLYITFPTEVAGNVTWDFTSNNSAPTLSNASRVITVTFDEPKTAGDSFWVMIAPADLTSLANVDFRFQTEDGTFTKRVSAQFGLCAAGAVTRVKLSIPTATTVTYLDYTVSDYSRLGEPVTQLQLQLPDNYYFTNFEQSSKLTLDSSYRCSFAIFSDMLDSKILGKALPFTYESEHALLTKTFTVSSSLNIGAHNALYTTAPYLLEEDFANVSAFTYQTTTATSNPTAIALDQYGLTGWLGVRVGAGSGAGCITVRHETVAEYPGRLDSSALCIKPGYTVNVKVTFNADQNNKYVFLNVGTIDVSQGLLQGNTGISANNSKVALTTNTSASFTNISTTERSFTASVISTSRLSWVVERTYNFTGNGFTSTTWYVYIDNIKVSIVQ